MTRLAHLLLAAVLLAPLAAAQSTWYVDVLGPGPGSGSLTDPYLTIQGAIDAPGTLDGDTVLVWAGTYRERLDLGGKSLQIRALFPDIETIVDAGGSGRVLTVSSGEGPGTLVKGMTLRNGRSAEGGGVFVSGAQLELRDCKILDSSAAGDGGGIRVAEGAALELTGCEIERNVSRGNGGGVSGPAVLRNCLVQDNRAIHGGGGSCALLIDCQVISNRAGGDAVAGDGGGALGCELQNCRLFGNFASRSGGGAADSTLRRCRVQTNRVAGSSVGWSVRGGGLVRCDASDTRVSRNLCGGYGSIVGAGAADCRLTDCVIRSHTVYEEIVHGVATYDCELVRCLVFDNVAIAGGSLGAGLFGGSAVDCRIESNRVSNFNVGGSADPTVGSVGGGAFGARLERCVLVGNTARQGGALFSCDAQRCTIYGGGTESLVAAASHVDTPGRPDRGRLRSCIALLSLPSYGSGVLSNGLVDVTYSLVTGGAPGIGNLDLDPLLTRPEFGDVELLPGSPCIDAGDPSLPADPDGSRADMGALAFDPVACGGPWVHGCGFTDVEPFGSLSATGASTLTIQIPDLEPGVMALPFLGLRSERRWVWPIGYLCIAGPLTQAAPAVVPTDGTFIWTPDPALAAAAGALVGDRVFFQVYFAAGTSSATGPERLSDMVETTFCP